jgi:transcriptional regulator with XRE-family HTH domain
LISLKEGVYTSSEPAEKDRKRVPVTKTHLKAFGARLKEARESKFSITQFARLLKKNAGTVRNYESGNYLPSVKTLIEIIEALEVSPDYLLGPLVEIPVDDELNTIVERVKRICGSEEDREVIKLLIHRYKLPAREKPSRKPKKNSR